MTRHARLRLASLWISVSACMVAAICDGWVAPLACTVVAGVALRLLTVSRNPM